MWAEFRSEFRSEKYIDEVSTFPWATLGESGIKVAWNQFQSVAITNSLQIPKLSVDFLELAPLNYFWLFWSIFHDFLRQQLKKWACVCWHFCFSRCEKIKFWKKKVKRLEIEEKVLKSQKNGNHLAFDYCVF